MELNKIHNIDCLAGLKLLADKSVHCVVTSPPYWGLRDYNTNGQVGLEDTHEEFILKLVKIFNEIYRVLRDDGTCWLNIGDSYSKGSNFLDSFYTVNKFKSICFADTFSIRISSHGIQIPLNDNVSKNHIFISLFGIQRIFIKKRQNKFCQVFNLFNAKGYASIGGSFSSVIRNDTTLEIIFNESDNISIIHSDLDADLNSIFGIFTSQQRPGEQIDTTLSIKESGKPITESIANVQSIRYAVTLDSSFKCLVDVDLVNNSVPFTDGSGSCSRNFGNLTIRKAGINKVNFFFQDIGIDFTSINVTHLFYENLFGSFVTHVQIYDSANKRTSELMSKNEMGIPDQLKRALMQDGWICRQTIIWHKTTAMPESVTDRCTKNHEYIFLLTKRPKYYYDHVAIMKDLADSTANDARLYDENYEATRPNRGGVNDRPDRGNGLLKPKASETFKRENSKRGVAIPGQQKGTHRPDREDTFANGKANKRSVWTVTPKAFAGAHFATYPQELIIDCIKAGTSEYGYCLNCGMPYKRYNKKSLVPTKKASFNSKADERDFAADLQDAGSNRAKDGHKPGWINAYETLGWVPSCKCSNTERGPGTVLDPFMGAGTTALVAQKLGRNFIGFELNPKYVEMANKRLNSHLGMFSPENIKAIKEQPIQLTIE